MEGYFIGVLALAVVIIAAAIVAKDDNKNFDAFLVLGIGLILISVFAIIDFATRPKKSSEYNLPEISIYQDGHEIQISEQITRDNGDILIFLDK